MLSARHAILAALVVIGVCGCPGTPTHGVFIINNGTISITAGNNQAASVGSQLPIPLTVAVVDTKGGPVGNVTVTFTVTSGGGALTNSTSITNAAGTAQTLMTMGPTLGKQTVTASAFGFNGSPVTFTETAFGPVAQITDAGGNGLGVGAGRQISLQAKVADAQGNGVSFAIVTFQVKTGAGFFPGGAAVVMSLATTNNQGIATMPFTLDFTPGPNTVSASVSPLTSSATFSDTGINLLASPLVEPSGAMGSGSPSIAVADVDSNGVLDILCANTLAKNVTVLINGGKGLLVAKQPMNLKGAAANPTGIAAGSIVNANFLADFVVCDSTNNEVDIFLNSPGPAKGTYGPPTTVAVGQAPGAVALADVNHDGMLDLIVVNTGGAGGGQSVTVLFGDGTGKFPSAMPGSPFPLGGSPSGLAVGDLNGDGVPDIVVTDNSNNNRIFILLSDKPNNTYHAPATFPIGTAPVGVAIADLNGDGVPDIVVTDNVLNAVTILTNTAAGANFTPAVVNLPANSNPIGVAIADMNGDGFPDIVVANNVGSSVSVLLNNGSGSFSLGGVAPGGSFPTGSSGGTATGPFGIVTGDFNGDGKIDALTGNNTPAPGTVSLLLGQ
jgi:hypothetical protein